MNTKHIGLVGALTAGLLLAGCGQQKQDWQQAQQQNTVAAYRTFINKYPDSDQARQARQRIATIRQQQKQQQQQQAWNTAQQTGTAAAYRQFLQQYPNSPNAGQARQQISDLQRQADWQNVQGSQNIQALQAFVAKYPNTPEASQAQAAIGRLKAQKKEQAAGMPAPQSRRNAEAAATPAPRGDYIVQLAAFTDEAHANKAQKQLQDRLKETLGSASLKVAAPENGGTYYRLTTTPMSKQDASKLCTALKDKGQDCLVTKR